MDNDLFIGLQEFVVGYSKAPEQPQSSARPICHPHAMTSTGREPTTIRINRFPASIGLFKMFLPWIFHIFTVQIQSQ